MRLNNKMISIFWFDGHGWKPLIIVVYVWVFTWLLFGSLISLCFVRSLFWVCAQIHQTFNGHLKLNSEFCIVFPFYLFFHAYIEGQDMQNPCNRLYCLSTVQDPYVFWNLPDLDMSPHTNWYSGMYCSVRDWQSTPVCMPIKTAGSICEWYVHIYVYTSCCSMIVIMFLPLGIHHVSMICTRILNTYQPTIYECVCQHQHVRDRTKHTNCIPISTKPNYSH